MKNENCFSPELSLINMFCFILIIHPILSFFHGVLYIVVNYCFVQDPVFKVMKRNYKNPFGSLKRVEIEFEIKVLCEDYKHSLKPDSFCLWKICHSSSIYFFKLSTAISIAVAWCIAVYFFRIASISETLQCMLQILWNQIKAEIIMGIRGLDVELGQAEKKRQRLSSS